MLKDLGIDPSTWLTNVTNEGTADVEGQSTIHISGDADVQKILTDLSKAVQNVPGAAAQGIDPSQFAGASQFIKDAHIDVYSGSDDHVLRKLDVSLDIQPPASAAAGISDVKIDLSIGVSDVNEPQTIQAPTNTKPLSDLQQQLGGIGILGSLGGASSLHRHGLDAQRAPPRPRRRSRSTCSASARPSSRATSPRPTSACADSVAPA